jgi:drug/metabolite transporter (DMT)-like permease
MIFLPPMLSRYHKQSDINKAYIQMHLSIILWGATGVLGRGIQLSEGLLVWYRMAIVAVSLFVYIYFTHGKFIVTKKQLLQLFIIGTLLMIHWVFFYGGIKYSNVSVTLSLLSSTTLFTAFIEPLITEKRFNRIELVFSIMAMAGIGIIFYSDENEYGTGILLALIAAFVGAFFNIMNKKVVTEIQSSVVSFYEILAGLLVLTVLMPFYISFFQPEKLLPDFNDWLMLFVLAVFCTHITLILSLNALKYLSAFTLNLSINLEPVYGILLAFIIFRENNNLNIWFFVGTGIIMLSVLLHTVYERKYMQKEQIV